MVPVCILVAALTGCGPDFSPNTYDATAAQKANKVDQGVIVGVHTVAISADGTVGTVAGGAAGGIAGSQVGGGGVTAAFGALGGSVIGGLVGNAAAHATEDTTATEYIVRASNGDLLSVTQKDPVPLKVGQHVLVITGNQARVVADYTVPIDTPKTSSEKPAAQAAKANATPDASAAAPPVAAAAPVVPPLATTSAVPVPVVVSPLLETQGADGANPEVPKITPVTPTTPTETPK